MINYQKAILTACAAGLGLTCLLLGGMAVFTFATGQPFPASSITPREDRFVWRLRDYDDARKDLPFSGDQVAVTRLNRLLDGLEKIAQGMDAQLSVLKRRRALALEENPIEASAAYREAYKNAAERIAGAFPYADSPAVVAAEALVLRAEAAAREKNPFGSADAGQLRLNGENADKAERYASRISAQELLPAALEIYSLSGALEDPRRAMTIPRGEDILFKAATGAAIGAAAVEGERLIIDAALLRLLKGDRQGAGVYIRSLTEPGENLGGPLSRRAAHFAAEYLYDFGDLDRAAELFSRFKDEESLSRQADALWLAGRADNARNLWIILSPQEGDGDAGILSRSLYNLAATAPARDREAAYLERLLGHEPLHLYGIIRYTRLLDAPRAIAILESTELLQEQPLLDLERLRRKQSSWNVERMIPETWQLVGRHGDDQRIYHWGAYYFDFQRRFDETALLLRQARRRSMDAPWMYLCEGLSLLREGRHVEGIERLRAIVPSNAPVSSPGTGAPGTAASGAGPAGLWQVPANIGRVLEAERSYAAALEYYEIAAAGVVKPAEAAKIQLRISRCMRALGREREGRRILEYARTLDPDNLNIRLELGSLSI